MSEGVAIVRVDAVDAVDSGGAATRRDECCRCDSLVSFSDSSDDERLVVGERGCLVDDDDEDEAKANAAAAEDEAVERVARLMMDGGRTKTAVGADASEEGLAEEGGESDLGAGKVSMGTPFPAVLGEASLEPIERSILRKNQPMWDCGPPKGRRTRGEWCRCLRRTALEAIIETKKKVRESAPAGFWNPK